MNTPINTKKFPIAMPKTKFRELYISMPEPKFRNGLNEIIIENRKQLPSYKNTSPDKLKNTKTVYRSEMIEFAQSFGWPNGYEPEI